MIPSATGRESRDGDLALFGVGRSMLDGYFT